MGATDYGLAFESIQRLSPMEIERGQRSQLANRILRILLHANMSSLGKCRDHLMVLIKLLAISNKSMDILLNVTEDSSEKSKQIDNEPTLMILARRIDGSPERSYDNVHCVKALQKLTHSVIRLV